MGGNGPEVDPGQMALCQGFQGWVSYSTGDACEDNGQGRDKSCDGDLDCCKSSIIAKGLQFVVWWSNMCYGSLTCDAAYTLSGSVNYHYTPTAPTPAPTPSPTPAPTPEIIYTASWV